MPNIISQPILMIDKNMQNSAVKIHAVYQYRTTGMHSALVGGDLESTVIHIWGIDKNGKTLLASCPLNTLSGYTAMEIASSVMVGIPVKDYPYINYEYTPSTDLSRIKSVQMFAESRIYPDSIDLVNTHTLSTTT